MNANSGEDIAGPGSALEDIEQEARRVLATAAAEGITVRVLGGLAIAMLAGKPIPEPLRRTYADIDIAVPRADSRRVAAMLERLGYEANQRFNNLHGSRRLLFYDRKNNRQLDVFVGAFKMCHELALDRRLDAVPDTLASADLLLTKLQIVEVNPKDLADAATLLYECEIGESDTAGTINTNRLVDVMSKDWGWYTTVSDNLVAVADLTRQRLAAQEAETVIGRIETINAAVERAPKSVSWKLRARVGRRVQWYELPEEVAR